MNIDDYSFHDSAILTVTETTDGQTVDYLLDFPIDWENNKFEKRTLRFKNVISHTITDIPFGGQPCIMEIINHGQVDKIFGTGRNQIKTVRQKIEIITNAGKRTIEFSDCDFV